MIDGDIAIGSDGDGDKCADQRTAHFAPLEPRSAHQSWIFGKKTKKKSKVIF